MSVSDIMKKKVITADVSISVRKACQIMTKKNVGSLLVTEKDSAVGIMTERDVIRKVVRTGKDPEILTVKRVMSTPLIVISPDASIELAVDTLIKNKIKKLPVVTSEDELVGILSATDIIANNPRYLKRVASLMVKRFDLVGG